MTFNMIFFFWDSQFTTYAYVKIFLFNEYHVMQILVWHSKNPPA